MTLPTAGHQTGAQSSHGAGIARQISAGAIVGLSAVIYSISYGALLFSGRLSPFVGVGVAVALVTAVIGALFGLLSEEGAFISGPDSNTISVMAGVLAVMGSVAHSSVMGLQIAMQTILFTSIVCAVVFYLLARMRLADLVRYIPFSVMAGFLASTGWLMSSGALNIISGTPLSIAGMEELFTHPLRADLFFGIGVAAALYWLARRVSGAVLIPLVMIAATLIVNLFLASGICSGGPCEPGYWMFTGLQNTQWMPPWTLDPGAVNVLKLIESLPSVLVVSFVGLLTILLSLASLEMNFRREFDLNRVLRTHAATSGIAALLGGFTGILSIGRTTLNRSAGGGALSGVVAALICLAMLLGAGGLISYVPKAALGGLVLYLGVNMLRQWLWDLRKFASRAELAEIVLILTLVANYGYLTGFSAGLVISCLIFVVTYSGIPLASLVTDLSLFTSSVVRPGHQVDILRAHGQRTMIYRLSGYVFFGSANKIDLMFQARDIGSVEGVVLDFSDVSGIDRSAIGVFQRILRRYGDLPLRFYFVHSAANDEQLHSISQDSEAARNVGYFPSLDHALEVAEENLISRHAPDDGVNSWFDFLDIQADRATFLGYCEARSVAADEVLCHDGEFSDSIYFVESGSFDVIKMSGKSPLRLAKLSKGAMAGEMAFYTGAARTASIVAVEDSRVQILHRDALLRMRTEHPSLAMRFDHMVIRKLAGSLERTNTLIATLG